MVKHENCNLFMSINWLSNEGISFLRGVWVGIIINQEIILLLNYSVIKKAKTVIDHTSIDTHQWT